MLHTKMKKKEVLAMNSFAPPSFPEQSRSADSLGLAACHDRKDRWIAWFPLWIIWLRLLRGEAVSVIAVVSTHIRVEKCCTAVGIFVQLDSADGHIVARAPAPADVISGWRELVALILFLQFHIWLISS